LAKKLGRYRYDQRYDIVGIISSNCSTYDLKNKKVLFRVDNQAVVQTINMKTSRSDKVMNLVRHMVLMNLKNNTTV
jgi:hypothetical protein